MEFRQALAIGSILADDYRIIDVLGQGGFGLTYRAFDTRLGSSVAIKEYFPADMALREDGTSVRVRSAREESVFEWGRAKFLDEAKTLARFRHPNIVRVARLFEANNTAYMVLDFEEGPNLGEWRARLGRAPRQAEIDAIATSLIDAVEAVHRGGILHRDIKPQNIIMRGGHEPVLIDFGAARQSLGQRSKTVHAIVTPGYSPKEQYALDVDRQGTWSDVYALGATFYFLVTGHTPPDALTRDLESAMPMETDGSQPYRSSFLDAIDAAMHVRAEDRPQDIASWRPMLLGVAPQRPERAPPAPTGLATVVAPRSPTLTRGPVRQDQPSARNVTFDQLGPPQQSGPPPSGSSWRLMGVSIAAVAAIAGGIWYYVLVHVPAQDEATWRAALATNTTQSYDDYLARHPNGAHVADARDRRRRVADARPSPTPTPTPVQPPDPTIPQIVLPRQPDPATLFPQPAPTPQPTPGPAPDPSPMPLPGRIEATPDPAPQPQPGPAQPTPPVRSTDGALAPRTLPGPVSEAELQRLRQAVAPAQWRLVPISSQTVRGFSEQHADFIRELERLSGNRINVRTIPPSEIGGSRNMLRDVRAGTDLLGFHSPTLSIERRRAYALLSGAVPFGLPPADHVRWMRADGTRLLEQFYARDNLAVRAIPCGIAGMTGGWTRRELRSPNDLRGLKVHATPLAAEVLRRLGATPVRFQTTEMLAAFNARTLDAVFNQTALLNVFVRTPAPAAVFQWPSWHTPSYLFDLVISAAHWQQMTRDQQALVDEACRRNLDRWATQFDSSQTEVLTQIRNARISIRPFTGPMMEALRKAADEVLAQEAAGNPDFKETLESYNRFRR